MQGNAETMAAVTDSRFKDFCEHHWVKHLPDRMRDELIAHLVQNPNKDTLSADCLLAWRAWKSAHALYTGRVIATPAPKHPAARRIPSWLIGIAITLAIALSAYVIVWLIRG